MHSNFSFQDTTFLHSNLLIAWPSNQHRNLDIPFNLSLCHTVQFIQLFIPFNLPNRNRKPVWYNFSVVNEKAPTDFFLWTSAGVEKGAKGGFNYYCIKLIDQQSKWNLKFYLSKQLSYLCIISVPRTFLFIVPFLYLI